MANLEIRGLRKAFPGVLANDDVHLLVRPGECHAILGENGAGKSTLIKMISGLYHPDAGEILLDGRLQHFSGPRDAIRVGIGVVHQHFMLIPALTVAENIVLGHEPTRVWLNRRQAENRVTQLSESVGLPLNPRARIETLPVGMQQRVEIVKALYRQAKILILDEPTAVLTPQETADLFTVIRRLNSENIPVIFISHKLDEVKAIADTVTVMRAGKTVQSIPAATATPAQLATLMVGREVVLEVKRAPQESGPVVLEVSNLAVRDARKLERVKNVSFSIREGEIFGVAGIDGNGQTELVEALTGLHKVAAGRVLYDGLDITRASVAERVAMGIGYVPQDRQMDGLVLPFSVADNMQLRDVSRQPFSRFGWLRKSKAGAFANDLVKEFDVRPPRSDLAASSLSGGNQQKVILAREVARNPRLLIAVQPTRGLDVGAIEGIHRHLLRLRAEGRAILLVSLELDEILILSDRIGVMHDGNMDVVMDAAMASRESIGLAMTGQLAPQEETGTP